MVHTAYGGFWRWQEPTHRVAMGEGSAAKLGSV
jgi:hypothetical protein